MKNHPVPELQKLLQQLTTTERESLAVSAETTVAYLYQLAGGHRKASAQMSVKIELATDRRVTRRNLRPDYFFSHETAA